MYRPFGLALSGGSLRGLAHIGVLKALEEEGYKPSYISGTSMGGLVAGLYANGMRPQELEREALKLKKNIFDPDVCGLLRSLFCFIIGCEPPAGGIIKGKRIEALLKELSGNTDMHAVKLPLAVTAVDVGSGETVIFTNRLNDFLKNPELFVVDDSPLYKGLRATMAIPVVFAPTYYKDRCLVDGGLTMFLPVHAAKQLGAKKIIAVTLGSGTMEEDNHLSLFDVGSRSISIMSYRISVPDEEAATIVLRPDIKHVSLTDVDKIPYCINAGYEAARSSMDLIKETFNYF